ncbi:hypothetical protein NHX12_002009 [Muraenolepis orangiensis]|uniref:R-spondin Fu-CRD domain-containing protein n=1 Tax=Muraenolepis orangiensis TaxID=630683 RepID=A0A9Q0IHS9_9TELE|nr:hypothetical protein NHX12_002009 [Muraenolepis orangiensis]
MRCVCVCVSRNPKGHRRYVPDYCFTAPHPSTAPPPALVRSLAASYGAYPVCKGCSVCSRDNGCVSCQPKLFLFLRRERMRQYGECLHDCPSGYYGMRSPDINMCSSRSYTPPTPTASPSPPPSPPTLTSDPTSTLCRNCLYYFI